MYLKEIKAVGFKSFAEKTIINFEPGITGVVGPNGSGKSNIVDAVRWVLGEQSVKALRGEGIMADVIFAGTEKREPLNRASVTITLNNSDHYFNLPYDEVSIRRTLYKDGTNEYFINNQKSRLMDVTELIVDSGLAKESFNIISQGEVEKIINSKSIDRRVIFEEAAGVLKYKNRKRKAIAKMERTNQNITRILDITGELEKELTPLKLQSEEANRFLKVKNRLQELELSFLALKINQESLNIVAIKEKILKQQADNKLLSNKGLGLENEELLLKENLTIFSKELQDLQRELMLNTRAELDLESEKKLVSERKKYQNQDLDYESKIFSLKEKEMDISNKQKKTIRQIESITKKVESLAKDITSFQKEIVKIKEEYQEYIKKNDQFIYDEKNLSYQIQSLEGILANHSNLYSGAKAVLNNSSLEGIAGVVGDLIDTSPKYALAVDTALLSASQFVVCENESAAKKAISYLKRGNLGKATFFPLTTIGPRAISNEILEKIKSDEAFIDIASNLIEYNQKYRNIILNQLGKTIIAKDLEGAIKLSKKTNHQLKIVTLEGEVLHVGGSLSGGKDKRVRNGIITERLELDKFKNQLKAVIAAKTSLKENISLLKEKYTEKEQELSLKSMSINEENLILNREQDLLTSFNEKLNNTKNEILSLESVVGEKIENFEQELLEKYYKIKELKEKQIEKIKEVSAKLEQIRIGLLGIDLKIKDCQDKEKQGEFDLKGFEIEAGKLETRIINFKEGLLETYNLDYEEALKKDLLDIDLKISGKEIITLKKELLKYPEVNVGATEAYERINERYTLLSKEKEDLLKAKEDLIEIINEMDEIMKDKFKTSFDQISEAFKVTFTDLFRGGKAYLELTDPTDLLNTGIEIVASPPGKKLKHLSLLSGGEKTLTAISLLFAMLKVKPVPFCIFDEVEAALDETNVVYFSEYLKSNYQDTQFIIITHQKKTMEYVDALYGVTMIEKGVSKLVSVKLK